MVGHLRFNASEVREAIVECLRASPTCRENGISRTCKLWSVVWNRKMMKLRRAMVGTLIKFADDKIKQSSILWPYESGCELVEALDDLEDIM